MQSRHHAKEDALMTAKLWRETIYFAKEAGFHTLRDVYTYLAKGRI